MNGKANEAAVVSASTAHITKIVAGPSRRIEVALIHRDGAAPEVLLQDLSYGPGLGWYAQKTIRLDREQAEALLKALCCARQAVGPGRQGACRLREGSAFGEPGPAPGEKPPRAARIISLDPNRKANR